MTYLAWWYNEHNNIKAQKERSVVFLCCNVMLLSCYYIIKSGCSHWKHNNITSFLSPVYVVMSLVWTWPTRFVYPLFYQQVIIFYQLCIDTLLELMLPSSCTDFSHTFAVNWFGWCIPDKSGTEQPRQQQNAHVHLDQQRNTAECSLLILEKVWSFINFNVHRRVKGLVYSINFAIRSTSINLTK